MTYFLEPDARPRRRQSGENAHDAAYSHLLCQAAGQKCAIALACVREIMRALPLMTIAAAPAFVAGMSIIRGEAVPVIDTGLLVGKPATQADRLVTIQANGRTIALLVEDVLGLYALDAELLGQMPPLLGEAAGGAIESIGRLDGELLLLLRTVAVLADQTLPLPDAERSLA